MKQSNKQNVPDTSVSHEDYIKQLKNYIKELERINDFYLKNARDQLASERRKLNFKIFKLQHLEKRDHSLTCSFEVDQSILDCINYN